MRAFRRRLLSFLLGVFVGVIGITFLFLGPIIFPGTATAIDGDSLRIAGYTVRLAGLDAPELPVVNGRQCRKHNPARGCQNAASSALTDLVRGRTVFCLMVAFDWRNWRPVVICKFNGIDINEWLIKNCYVNPPKDPGHTIPYYDEIFRTRDCVTTPEISHRIEAILTSRT